MNNLEVIKIGGENAGCDLETTVSYVKANKVNADQVLVVSAMRDDDFNTTDQLKNIADMLNIGDIKGAVYIFQEIFNFHKIALEKQNGGGIIGELKKYFNNIQNGFDLNLNKNLSEENDFCINVNGEKISLLGFGENISAFVHAKMLENTGIESEIIDTNKLTLPENQNYTTAIKNYFSSEINRILESGKIPVVGGFIGNIPGGILQNIDRGYTDATASLLALSQVDSYNKTRLNIFKSVDGILGADPRLFVKGTEINLVSHLDYLTARELTGGSIGGKAKFLHEYALSEEIMNAGIELKIMNPKKQNLGTTISNKKDILSSGVEIVNKRDNITFVKITKASFSEGVGDVEKIFELVRQRGFSIDMIITSETEVSFSLEVKDESTLNELQNTLESEFFNENISEINNVEIQKNMTLIHCIGQNLEKDYQTHLAYALITLTSADIKIHHIGGARTKGAIIFAVDSDNAIKSVQLLAKQFSLVKEAK